MPVLFDDLNKGDLEVQVFTCHFVVQIKGYGFVGNLNNQGRDGLSARTLKVDALANGEVFGARDLGGGDGLNQLFVMARRMLRAGR